MRHCIHCQITPWFLCLRGIGFILFSNTNDTGDLAVHAGLAQSVFLRIIPFNKDALQLCAFEHVLTPTKMEAVVSALAPAVLNELETVSPSSNQVWIELFSSALSATDQSTQVVASALVLSAHDFIPVQAHGTSRGGVAEESKARKLRKLSFQRILEAGGSTLLGNLSAGLSTYGTSSDRAAGSDFSSTLSALISLLPQSVQAYSDISAQVAAALRRIQPPEFLSAFVTDAAGFGAELDWCKKLNSPLTSAHAILERLDNVIREFPRVELLLDGVSDVAGALHRAITSVLGEGADASLNRIEALDVALSDYMLILEQDDLSPTQRLERVCDSAKAAAVRVSKHSEAGGGAPASEVRSQSLSGTAFYYADEFLQLKEVLRRPSEPLETLKSLLQGSENGALGAPQCVLKALSQKSPNDEFSKEVKALSAFASEYFAQAAQDQAFTGMNPLVLPDEVPGLLLTGRFTKLPIATLIYDYMTATTGLSHMPCPTTEHFTTVPCWWLGLDVLFRLLVAAGVPLADTEQLAACVDKMIKRTWSQPDNGRDTAVAKMITVFLSNCQTRHEALVATSLSFERLSTPISSSQAMMIFNAWEKMHTECLLASQHAAFKSSAAAHPNGSPLKKQKNTFHAPPSSSTTGGSSGNSGSGAQSPRSNSVQSTSGVLKGTGELTKLMELSSTISSAGESKYLRIGKSFYDLERARDDTAMKSPTYPMGVLKYAFLSSPQEKKTSVLSQGNPFQRNRSCLAPSIPRFFGF
jgi:hypothetical protein